VTEFVSFRIVDWKM